MGNEGKPDAKLDQTSDSKCRDSGAARQEAGHGMQELSDRAKAYCEARKGGLRDKSTSEHLGPQPEFFDSSSTKAARVWDDRDNLTYIRNSDGTTTDIKYDKQNNPIEIKNADGTWKKEKDGWNCFDDKNKKIMHLDGDVKIGEQGDIIFKEKGGYTETHSPDGKWSREGFPDGHKETIYSDRHEIEDAAHNRTITTSYNGSEVHLDAQNHVTSIKRADGKTTSFEYNDDTLTRIKNPDGSEDRLSSGGWSKYDSNGEFQGKENAKYSVDKDGTVIRQATDDSPTEYKHLDNTREIKFSNGAEMDYDKNGRLERSVYVDKGGKIEKIVRLDYDKDGDIAGVSQWAKDGSKTRSYRKGLDGKWFKEDYTAAGIHDLDHTYDVNSKGEVIETDAHGHKKVLYSSPEQTVTP
jgi:YD repeat-containing protein